MPEDDLDIFYSCVVGCLYTIRDIKDKDQRKEKHKRILGSCF